MLPLILSPSFLKKQKLDFLKVYNYDKYKIILNRYLRIIL